MNKKQNSLLAIQQIEHPIVWYVVRKNPASVLHQKLYLCFHILPVVWLRAVLPFKFPPISSLCLYLCVLKYTFYHQLCKIVDIYQESHVHKALKPLLLKVIQKINPPVLPSPQSGRIGYTGWSCAMSSSPLPAWRGQRQPQQFPLCPCSVRAQRLIDQSK